MSVYTVDAEQIIFHSISVIANNEQEAMEKVNEIIRKQKNLSTSQEINIKTVFRSKNHLP
jgi:archaellum biogenesis ATPase FlaH